MEAGAARVAPVFSRAKMKVLFASHERSAFAFSALMNGTFLRLFSGIITFSIAASCLAQHEGEYSDAKYQVQPIMTRYAKTVDKITFNTTARIFRNVQLQEADSFDGWTIDADLTVPIPWVKWLQVRLYYPFYTEGEARVTKPGSRQFGQSVDVRGYAGLYDLASLEVDAQFIDEKDKGFNMAAYAGAGTHTRVLWTTAGGDRYNDQGNYGFGGLRADWRCGEAWRFVANAGGRYYWVSDDLNPTGGGDRFLLADISLAAIYHPWQCPIYPVAELVYMGEFSKFNSLLFAPEIIWAVCSNFELKAGAVVGLTGDGEDIGGRFQATLRF
jgi:hypothetical protein